MAPSLAILVFSRSLFSRTSRLPTLPHHSHSSRVNKSEKLSGGRPPHTRHVTLRGALRRRRSPSRPHATRDVTHRQAEVANRRRGDSAVRMPLACLPLGIFTPWHVEKRPTAEMVRFVTPPTGRVCGSRNHSAAMPVANYSSPSALAAAGRLGVRSPGRITPPLQLCSSGGCRTCFLAWRATAIHAAASWAATFLTTATQRSRGQPARSAARKHNQYRYRYTAKVSGWGPCKGGVSK